MVLSLEEVPAPDLSYSWDNLERHHRKDELSYVKTLQQKQQENNSMFKQRQGKETIFLPGLKYGSVSSPAHYKR